MGFSEKNYQKEIGNMERWKEVFAGIIPKAVYQMQLINGEKQGLTIELSSGHTCVRISFGAVLAVRMLDEGIVQSGIYSDSEIQKYKRNDFQNIIYEVHGGEFAEQILAELIDEGLSGEALLSKFKERQAQIRPAAEAMLHNAEEIANGNAPFETYEDVFGSEDE